MLNRRVTLAIAALLVGTLLLSACGALAAPATQSKTSSTERSITVVGQGKAGGTPDVAHTNIGVETTGASAQEAVNANKERMANLLDKLRSLGIPDKDIQTSNFSIFTEQRQVVAPGETTGAGAYEIRYHVSNQVNVTLRDMTKLGDVLDQAVAAGANTIYGVYFEVTDTSNLEATAREKAIADAKARAESLAKLTGVSLGEVLVVSEVIGGPGPLYAKGLGGGDISASTSIQPGEFEVDVSVQVTYAIK